MTESKIPPNVMSFVAKCTTVVGRHAEELFDTSIGVDLTRGVIESPIEQILHVAIQTLAKIAEVQTSYGIEPVKVGEYWYPLGLSTHPQYHFDPYRVDFLFNYNDYQIEEKKISERYLVVECDGHNWHERTEKERRYEKRRDRFLASKGLTVFHYTGSEVVSEPFRVAAEILEHLVPWASKDEFIELVNAYMSED